MLWAESPVLISLKPDLITNNQKKIVNPNVCKEIDLIDQYVITISNHH